ncbi:25S rRNA (cytosine-C(5))-methyltransferase NSUN5 [Rhododendron vialii]|uniref:25S rRNA (cytosine-C(5))-methyltransferase NSUN5 n=1 Tax=Rhododendron vialii TaxID=182163 RepID=UPI00265F77C4|nr:25S rRNA (cytosine-C(5))-methyltransferase NSUN5 [Rhododendron vialii]
MSRFKKLPAATRAAAEKPENRRPSSADRSAYFARREAAKVLRTVLQGDAKRRAVGSIKSLVYSPSVRNKRGTFALVCETLKYLSIIKEVLGSANVLNSKWKRQGELIYTVTYDILFGQAASLVGDAEKFLLLRKDALQSALAQLLVRKGMKDIKDLTACQKFPDISKPRYVRVNTLKLDLKSALQELGKQNKVHEDDMVPDLLELPPGVDLHNHPLVLNGSVFMQGKASSMAAAALQPEPGWEVLDACAAPGNKTVHLAALTHGKGKILACELHKERVQRLKETINLAGAANVEVLNEDFLNLNPKHTSYSKVRAILLDPSCSGSGTSAVRLDHLLPSHGAGNDDAGINRLRKLQAFQKKALAHALSFPAVERLVYSTCSVHQIENEDVIKSVLPLALSLGFQLATPFPLWARRGLPVVEGSEHLLRTDPAEDKEGFFIALFIRKSTIAENRPERRPSSSTTTTATSEAICSEKSSISSVKKKQRNKYKLHLYCPSAKLSRMWLHPRYLARKRATRI